MLWRYSNGRARRNPNDSAEKGWIFEMVTNLSNLIRDVSYQIGEEKKEQTENFIPLIRANNIVDGILVFNDLLHIPIKRVSNVQLLQVGDVVVAMSGGSKKVVGKTVVLKEKWKGTFGAFCALKIKFLWKLIILLTI